MAARGNSRARNEIIEMLKEDHQRVKKAFKTAEKLHSQEEHEELQALVEQTCAEVQVHPSGKFLPHAVVVGGTH